MKHRDQQESTESVDSVQNFYYEMYLKNQSRHRLLNCCGIILLIIIIAIIIYMKAG